MKKMKKMKKLTYLLLGVALLSTASCNLFYNEDTKEPIELENAIEIDTVIIAEVEVEADYFEENDSVTYTDSMVVYKLIIGSFKTFEYAVAFAEANNAELMDIDERGFYKVSLGDYKYRVDAGYAIAELDSPAWVLPKVEY